MLPSPPLPNDHIISFLCPLLFRSSVVKFPLKNAPVHSTCYLVACLGQVAWLNLLLCTTRSKSRDRFMSHLFPEHFFRTFFSQDLPLSFSLNTWESKIYPRHGVRKRIAFFTVSILKRSNFSGRNFDRIFR